MFDKRKFIVSSLFVMLALHIMTEVTEGSTQIVRRRFLQDSPDNIHVEAEEGRTYPPSHPKFWLCLLAAASLIFMAAVCSGMTVGYLSIDELQLEIYKDQGTEEQQRQANIILPIIHQHHMLLCTLLIGNAFAMEALPIFFDKVVPPAFAVLISVIFIVVAGEIIPQALCTGPRQLSIAERLTPMIKIIMIILWPISYPLARMLDSYFGEHGATRFQKNELKALIELHGNQKGGHSTGFTQAEINMITSTIDLKDKTVHKVMVPAADIFSINKSSQLNKDLLTRISASGYSYIVVYESSKDTIVGTFRAKQLIDVECSGRKISELSIIHPALFVQSDTSLLEMLMIFKQRKTKIGFLVEPLNREQAVNQSIRSISNQVVDDKKAQKVVGLISLKMLFQEIVKKEFQDQDNHVRLQSMNPHTQTTNTRFLREAQESVEK